MTNREWMQSLTDDVLGRFLCEVSVPYGGSRECDSDCPFQKFCSNGHTGSTIWLNEEHVASSNNEV